MDWDLKMIGSWDLDELVEHDGAAALRGPATTRAECSVDLKLGGMGEFGDADARRKEQAVVSVSAVAVVPSGSPLKRPRAGQCPSCAVDGCKADLGKCRDYHRRHKVCEAHSKTTVVVVSGRQMRFCQQCSRFHLLAEFDEAKRSCRKRLEGHNRRRRKPQADSMSSGSFMPSQQGTRFASFPTPRPEPSWSGIIKSEDSNPSYYSSQVMSNSQHFAGKISSYSKERRHFPFLQDGDQMSFSTTASAIDIPVCQPLLNAVAPPAESSSSSSRKMFSDGQLMHALDSDCALSLLSSPANSSNIEVHRLVRPTEHIAVPQHLVPNLQFSSSSWFTCSQAAITGFTFPSGTMESEQLNTALVPRLNANEMNCHGMFHIGADGSSDGTSPSHPFTWQ